MSSCDTIPRIVVITKTFHGGEFAVESMESVYPYAHKMVYVHSDESWTGTMAGNNVAPLIEEWARTRDTQGKIVNLKATGKSQVEQYAQGFDWIYQNVPDFDFIMYVDTDEVWDGAELEKATAYLQSSAAQAFCARMVTYIKSPFFQISGEPLAPVVFVRKGSNYSGVRGNGITDKFLMKDVTFHHFCSVRSSFEEVWKKHQASCACENVPLVDKQEFMEKWDKIPASKNLLPIGGSEHHWPSATLIPPTKLPRILQKNKLVRSWMNYHRSFNPASHRNTMALTMIVAGGEADLLARCLESVKPLDFDEIIIGVTADDQAVVEAAKKYATLVIKVQWIDDFADARNRVLAHVHSDYWMWLDADDVIIDDDIANMKKLCEIIRKNPHSRDIYKLPYNVGSGMNGSDAVMRDRIIKTATGLKWRDCVHETLDYENDALSQGKYKSSRCMDVMITHMPREGKKSGNRNLHILEYAILSAPDPKFRYKFYYAMELHTLEQYERAIPLLISLVEMGVKRKESRSMLAYMCLKISRHFAYLKFPIEINPATMDLGLKYARLGVDISKEYSELYVVLGDLASHDGKPEDAIKWYEQAAKCRLGTGGIQEAMYYDFVPCDKLSCAYAKQGNIELALHYNKRCIQKIPGDARLKKNREILLEALQSMEKQSKYECRDPRNATTDKPLIEERDMNGNPTHQYFPREK